VVQENVEQYMVMVAELEKLLPLSATRQEGKKQSNDTEEFLRLDAPSRPDLLAALP
jgi:hypothetical protein